MKEKKFCTQGSSEVEIDKKVVSMKIKISELKFCKSPGTPQVLLFNFDFSWLLYN